MRTRVLFRATCCSSARAFYDGRLVVAFAAFSKGSQSSGSPRRGPVAFSAFLTRLGSPARWVRSVVLLSLLVWCVVLALPALVSVVSFVQASRAQFPTQFLQSLLCAKFYESDGRSAASMKKRVLNVGTTTVLALDAEPRYVSRWSFARSGQAVRTLQEGPMAGFCPHNAQLLIRSFAAQASCATEPHCQSEVANVIAWCVVLLRRVGTLPTSGPRKLGPSRTTIGAGATLLREGKRATCSSPASRARASSFSRSPCFLALLDQYLADEAECPDALQNLESSSDVAEQNQWNAMFKLLLPLRRGARVHLGSGSAQRSDAVSDLHVRV